MDWTIKGYKNSGRLDIHGNTIYEGSVIDADGYKSDIVNNKFHCVEFDEGMFGSDIYSDFEPLARYNTIEVVGHCEDFRDIYESGGWSGNLGAVMKDEIGTFNAGAARALVKHVKRFELGNVLATIKSAAKRGESRTMWRMGLESETVNQLKYMGYDIQIPPSDMTNVTHIISW